MAYTFLQLTNKVLTRLNETALTQSNFASATGFNQQAKDAVNAAIKDIIHLYQFWPFLRVAQTITTSSSTNEYSISQSLAPVDFYTMQIRKDNTATPPVVQSVLTYMDYNLYMRYRFPVDAQADSTQYSQPQWVTRPTSGSTIIVSPWPDRVYTIDYFIYEVPAELVNYNDTTVIPDQFIDVLINRAMYYAYMFRENIESASGIKDESKQGINQMLRQIVPGFTDAKDPRVVRPRALTGPSRFF